VAELEDSYDGWAPGYEADLLAAGYRLPAIAAGLAGRYLPLETTPILDAGCGTGFIGEALAVLGYQGLEGLDLSEGMLEVARSKNIYDAVHQGRLGAALDLPDGRFEAVLAIGVLTQGHAAAESFDELLRVIRPGGHMIFSIRVDNAVGAPYLNRMAGFETDGRWHLVAATIGFASMPFGEPEVRHQVFVYRTAGA
jgi:predicted TPR repeat methyltransferase